jgi:hypothetical protein
MHCSIGQPEKPNNYSQNNLAMPGGNMTRNKHPTTHVGPEEANALYTFHCNCYILFLQNEIDFERKCGLGGWCGWVGWGGLLVQQTDVIYFLFLYYE